MDHFFILWQKSTDNHGLSANLCNKFQHLKNRDLKKKEADIRPHTVQIKPISLPTFSKISSTRSI